MPPKRFWFWEKRVQAPGHQIQDQSWRVDREWRWIPRRNQSRRGHRSDSLLGIDHPCFICFFTKKRDRGKRKECVRLDIKNIHKVNEPPQHEKYRWGQSLLPGSSPRKNMMQHKLNPIPPHNRIIHILHLIHKEHGQ